MKKTLSIKKFALMFACVLFIAFIGIFASACGDDDNKKSAKLTSVSANNLEEYYHNTATIDFSAVTLSATYDDNSTKTLNSGEVDVDFENIKDGTEFVLYTDGLSAMPAGNLTLGTYDITCRVVGSETVFNLGTVTVSDNMNLIYDLLLFSEPEFVTTYNANLNSAVHEDSFYDTADGYTVGDDNDFIFKPQMSLISKENSQTVYEPSNFNVNVSVYHVVNGNSTLLNDSTYYTFDADNFAFDFTDSAIGETFRVEMKPTDFATDATGNPINGVSFTFTVQDGWNAYSADDIARINLVGDLDPETERYARSSSQSIFYNADSQSYEKRHTYEIWEQFLLDKGYSAENLQDVNGIFMHGNINITADDIPADFFVTSAETSAESVVGSLRDFSLLYMHYLDQDFMFNGNYFMIDTSALPLGMSIVSGDNFTLYTDNQSTWTAGHSTVFAFSGKLDNTSTATATLKNVNAKGNTGGVISGEDSEALKASGGLILLKSMHGTTSVDNCLAKEFLIAWFAESTQENENGNLYINQVKTYDCFNSGLFAYASDNNTISNSEFKRFGGPVMLLVSEGSDNTMERPAGFAVDDSSVLESFVNGTEVWFAMQGSGASGIATQLFGMELLFNQVGTSITSTISNGQGGTNNVVNLVALMLDSEYLASTETTIFVDYSRGEVGPTNLAFSTYNNPIFASIPAQAPKFITNAGQHAIYTGGTSLTLLGAEALSGNQLYILYPMGATTIGAVLDLYEYQAPQA